MRLNNKVVLIIGGCGGIGRAIVERFIQEGAIVYSADLVAINNNSVSAKTNNGRFIPLDITSEQQVIAAMDTILKEIGKLDILVNAAGIELEKTIEQTSLAEWNQSFAVNVSGTFLTCKHALPLLRKAAADNGSASIINLGSYDGFIADPALAAYCASKGAVHALTRAMAVDHGAEGIRVNAICPGYIDTPMLQKFFSGAGSGGSNRTIDNLKEAVCAIHPLRTYGAPADVANLALWLASDEARYASGQLWVLDGGLSAQVQQMRL